MTEQNAMLRPFVDHEQHGSGHNNRMHFGKVTRHDRIYQEAAKTGVGKAHLDHYSAVQQKD